MQYSISEKLMWFALAGRCFRYLEEKETHTDRKRARQIFRQMTARIPDIGTLTENPLRICLSAGMVWLSIYEAADGQMEDACFGEMVQYSMESPLVKATYKGKAKTAFTMEAQQKRAGFAAKTNPLAKDNPFQWCTEVILGRDVDEYTILYHQCGLCALGRQEGLLCLVPYMCVLDIMSIEWMGGVLYRTKTLATGGNCCDFYICRKGSKWEESAHENVR
ncbi:MAG: L-2-amino-thiazoline-4-carboxylic acid hydrolase [Faecousia sp.]